MGTRITGVFSCSVRIPHGREVQILNPRGARISLPIIITAMETRRGQSVSEFAEKNDSVFIAHSYGRIYSPRNAPGVLPSTKSHMSHAQ